MAGSMTSAFSDDDQATVSDINVTPLVDVILVLLIVFMVTVPAIVATAPIKVNLPESMAAGGESIQQPLFISIAPDQDGTIQVYVNQVKTDPNGLVGALKSLGVLPHDQRVTLAADKTIPYGAVVKVMDALHSLGLRKIALVTRHVGDKAAPSP